MNFSISNKYPIGNYQMHELLQYRT